MVSAYIRPCYLNLDKPFIIEGRIHDLGGTVYWTIARLTEDDARLLVDEGLNWRDVIDWEKHWYKLEILKLEKQQNEIANKLKELKNEN
jgi:hypothetical protein